MSTDDSANLGNRSRRRPIVARAAIVLVLFLVLIAALAIREHLQSLNCRPPNDYVIDDPAQLDELYQELLEYEHESWVRRYDPKASSGGYNLVLFRRRVPLLIDMNGRIVHAWPEVRVTGRARLNRDGSLAVIGTDNLIKEYTWEGELAWHFRLDDIHDLPHHDLIRLRNENYLILVHDGQSYADYLLEVNRAGEVVWSWFVEDHVGEFPTWDPESTDPSHSNSIHELPPNRWFDSGDERFEPGNILVSARNLNTIFIIDKTSGEVVWTHSQGFDGQHEAVMLERGLRGAGLIMVFNNGLENLNDYRRSVVEAINPVSGERKWKYSSDYFFSSVGGTAQPLPRNNVLITSSHGGRVFEITGWGRIVWEWIPPYMPMRVERVAYDHCPQLAGLPTPEETQVIPEDRRPFVDTDLYAFDFRWQTDKKKINGRDRRVIRSTDGCRTLRIPLGALVRAEFGLDGERLAGRSIRGRFRLTIGEVGGTPETLMDVTLDQESDEIWHRETANIARFGLKQVEMCIETAIDGDVDDPTGIVIWSNPRILSRAERERRAARSARVSEQEKKLERQQLEALGYVD
jgi:hypothetical protein